MTRHTAHGTHGTWHTHELTTRVGWAGEMHLGGFMASGKAYIESRRITHVINAAVRHKRSAPSPLFFQRYAAGRLTCAHTVMGGPI